MAKRTLGWVQNPSKLSNLKIVVSLFEKDSKYNKWLRKNRLPLLKKYSLISDENYISFMHKLSDDEITIQYVTLKGQGAGNYQFRFNNNHEYNNPFGRNRSQFSKNMRENLIAFVDKLQNSNVEFTEFDFEEFDISQLGYGDFVYCDPPYLITTGSYNDGNRGFKNWSEKEEKALYDFLDRLNDRDDVRILHQQIEQVQESSDLCACVNGA